MESPSRTTRWVGFGALVAVVLLTFVALTSMKGVNQNGIARPLLSFAAVADLTTGSVSNTPFAPSGSSSATTMTSRPMKASAGSASPDAAVSEEGAERGDPALDGESKGGKAENKVADYKGSGSSSSSSSSSSTTASTTSTTASSSSSSSSSTTSSSMTKSKSSDDGTFTLSSPTMTNMAPLPTDYTCEAYQANGNDDFQAKSSAGSSPPLTWSNVPKKTEKLLLSMTSTSDTPDHTCSRYEWVVYDIEPDSTGIDIQSSASTEPPSVGRFGGTFPGEAKFRYAAPCGWGSSYKYYTFTLYAIGGDLYQKYTKSADTMNVWNEPAVLGPDLIKYAIQKDWVLETATLTTKFCPTANGEAGCTEPSKIVTENEDAGDCI